MREEEENRISIATIHKDIQYLQQQMNKMSQQLEKDYATKEEVAYIREKTNNTQKLVVGILAAVGTSVLSFLIWLIQNSINK